MLVPAVLALLTGLFKFIARPGSALTPDDCAVAGELLIAGVALQTGLVGRIVLALADIGKLEEPSTLAVLTNVEVARLLLVELVVLAALVIAVFMFAAWLKAMHGGPDEVLTYETAIRTSVRAMAILWALPILNFVAPFIIHRWWAGPGG